MPFAQGLLYCTAQHSQKCPVVIPIFECERGPKERKRTRLLVPTQANETTASQDHMARPYPRSGRSPDQTGGMQGQVGHQIWWYTPIVRVCALHINGVLQYLEHTSRDTTHLAFVHIKQGLVRKVTSLDFTAMSTNSAPPTSSVKVYVHASPPCPPPTRQLLLTSSLLRALREAAADPSLVRHVPWLS